MAPKADVDAWTRLIRQALRDARRLTGMPGLCGTETTRHHSVLPTRVALGRTGSKERSRPGAAAAGRPGRRSLTNLYIEEQ